MWNLSDTGKYTEHFAFRFPRAWSYADMRAGHTDKEKREEIRDAAKAMPPPPQSPGIRWAFRVLFEKAGCRAFDVENVPKLIIDAFSEDRISADKSPHISLALYPDDTIDFVGMVQVAGNREKVDWTTVEIFREK